MIADIMKLLTALRWASGPRYHQSVRTIFSETGVVEPHLQADTMQRVETFWKTWLQSSLPVAGEVVSKY